MKTDYEIFKKERLISFLQGLQDLDPQSSSDAEMVFQQCEKFVLPPTEKIEDIKTLLSKQLINKESLDELDDLLQISFLEDGDLMVGMGNRLSKSHSY